VKFLVGIDLEKSKIRKAAMIAKQLNLSKKTKFLAKSVYDFKPKNKFDTVVCSDVIEHVDDPVTLIKKLLSFCKKSGRVVLTYPNIFLTDMGRHIVYFGKDIKEIARKTDHTRPINRELVKQWIKLAGGTIVKHRYIPNFLLPINELVIIKNV
jgi:2-polyprenyl-3-methyl-5-hydroxy-6-metoxy-1,4-benzoquinol methylase